MSNEAQERMIYAEMEKRMVANMTHLLKYLNCGESSENFAMIVNPCSNKVHLFAGL